MKNIKEKINKIFCKIFGHKVNLRDKIIFEIKKVAVNRENFKNQKLFCKRCGAYEEI